MYDVKNNIVVLMEERMGAFGWVVPVISCDKVH